MITIEQMVRNEVMACVSDMVELLNQSDSEFSDYCLDNWPSLENEEGDYEYQDIYEYWLVTDWLAEKLQEQGHFIIDFFNIKIWGRPTTGQSISSDAVIKRIYNNLIKGE